MPSRDDWYPNTVVHPEHLDIYNDGSKLDNGVVSGIYSEKMDLRISLQLPDYCSVFQAEVMAIYGSILANAEPFTRVSVVSDSQATIRFLSDLVINSRIISVLVCRSLV